MAIKVGFVSLGCPKNLVDTEYMIGELHSDENFEIVANSDAADVVVINTCGFIESAKQEAIDTIFEFVEKKKNGLKSIVVTGCLAQRYKEEIIKSIPEVDAVLGNYSNSVLKIAIENSLKGEKFQHFNSECCIKYGKDRVLATPAHYAYLKIAEGCNNFCSYCAIPNIKGRYKSRPIEDILKEAKWLESKNVKELIVVAQDTTYYGFDIYKEFKLNQILQELATFNFKWIRFLYAYPERISRRLVETVRDNKNILPYFDMPIQHINDEILKRMNRKTNSKQIFEKVELIRNILPNATLRTTLIAGFPGETDEQFEELLNFVKEIKFDRLGCFSYSKEEGTRAFNFENHVSEKVKKLRTKLIYNESSNILHKKAIECIGKNMEVIIDKKSSGVYVGRTEKDAPDIDCLVYFKANTNLNIGDIVNVKVEDVNENDLFGTVS